MRQLLKPQQLYDYQKECVLHMLYNDDAMLWLQMGLGKTPITLTTIVDRMRAGQVRKTLVFGPLRVIQAVWHREARKWEHTRHLRFSILHGDVHKRRRALFADADVYLCNYENMNWLAHELAHYFISQNKPLPFDMVVYDEVSKMKNSTALRMAGGNRDRVDRHGNEYKEKVLGWRRMLPHFKYRVGLTGTPASNGYLDLFGQFLSVDGGNRLGEYVTPYKDKYFTADYNGWGHTPTESGKAYIEAAISDITKKMDAKDYLDMPEVRVTNVLVEMPAKARKAYEEVEAQMFTQLETGAEIEVFSKSSVSNKCLQFANGSPYTDLDGNWEAVHDAKLKALEDILEEAAGQPVLCSYSFKSDAERIMKKFKKYRPVNMTDTAANLTEKVVNDWNSGKIKLLIGHPACLHPSTKVLTEHRGWVNLVDVGRDEKVHDGVEFVSHDGCSYSGQREVVERFGITLTPNHKLLIDNEWMEARDVRDCESTREKASYQYEGDDEYLSEMFKVRLQQDDAHNEAEQRDDRGPSSGVCEELTLRKKEKVYDLVNCGPRNRFLIKNDDDEVFISHNSMGHGIDGLQDSGSMVVWFGVNWSLELYEQMNARIARNGQTQPVSIVRIVCADSVDLAVVDAIERKFDDQEGLKAALQRYRDGITTNELSVNFF